MKRAVFILFVFSWQLEAAEWTLLEDPDLDLALVETVPVGTALGLADIPDAAEVFTDLIASAETSLFSGQFYITDAEGEPLRPILDLLTAKAGELDELRLLVDKKMVAQNQEVLDRLRNTPGIALAEYDITGLTGGIHHAKYFCVDDRACFVGSQNFDWRSLKHIREMGVLLESRPLAVMLRKVFEADWQLGMGRAYPHKTAGRKAVGFTNPNKGIAYVKPVLSPAKLPVQGFGDGLETFVELIDSARSSIRSEVMTYSLTGYDKSVRDDLDAAFRRAAARGVKISFLVSDWNNRRPNIDEVKRLAALPGIEVKITTIPQAEEGFVPYARVDHAKIMVVDDEVGWVGTSNFSPDYFTGSRNLELVFKYPAEVKKLAKSFDQVWNSPYARRLEQDREYVMPKRN
ncbi:MAG: hypothetical protein A2284_05630 [Deltaproteobacteria bacterium RIFOXYA12_FULL_61_11]|nr:MAG: hypothetical protein A2284_05630 [Deltaproteobacteria bacterium RIFOXYA12_FULL_61_11]